MLALSTRRQHLPNPHYSSTSPAAQSFSFQQLPQQPAAHQLFDQKLLNDYLNSQQPLARAPSASLMTSAFDFANPAIRIQQSTPVQQLQQTSMLSTTGLDSWNGYSTQQPLQNSTRGHQRAASSSSVGSRASPFTATAPYQQFPNQIPTPTQTPTQATYINATNFPNYTPTSSTLDQTMAAHMSMKQALMDQGEDVPDFAHSARQSVSSYGHDSPATPHTTQGDDLDFKMPTNDIRQPIVPKFERTYTDIAADNFYDPSVAAQPTQTKSTQSSLLSPYRSNPNETVQRALQAAQYARSLSPTSSGSRGDSPFRRSSPYRQANGSYNPAMGANGVIRHEQNRHADAAYAMKSQVRSSEEAEPKTISPKDAMLVYPEADDDSKMPLFPDNSASDFPDQYSTATQSSFDTTAGQSVRRDSWATPQFTSNYSTSVASALPQNSKFDFTVPVSTNMPSLPLTATLQYRSTPSSMQSAIEQTPEFPAHLTSMESSASEADPPSGSQGSDLYVRKPTSSSADSGTYSCTYHGCSQRFETPQKLQKHKREGHRNASVSAAMTSAAILERNSQAGPHKCDRINPTTGKPCSTIFSRPYDLTRHEDTIHNARKQKVRCALCVEEKTFSRNDALTRHMRVVHPEVDFPGKHRRRGGNHD